MVEAAYNDVVKDKDDDKMMMFSSTVRTKSKKPVKALAKLSRNNDFNGIEDNFVETPRQSNRLRSSMNFGSGNPSRTMNMRQSAQNVAQRRSLMAVNKEHASNYASPTRNLFKTNKESLEDMLVRKLKQKYIDSNAAFCTMLLQDNETANLLSNNFMSNNSSAKVTRRNHSKHATVTGSNDKVGSSRYRTKTSQH